MDISYLLGLPRSLLHQDCEFEDRSFSHSYAFGTVACAGFLSFCANTQDKVDLSMKSLQKANEHSHNVRPSSTKNLASPEGYCMGQERVAGLYE